MTQKPAILLVEDDTFTGRLMEIQFKKQGYEVVLVAGAEEALAALEQRPFDLVLSDVLMPGMSGLELLDVIRKTRKPTDLPVILLTALGDAKSILEGIQRGANDFLVKTNEFGIVLAKIQLHLEMKRLAQAEHAPKVAVLPGFVRASGDGPWNLDCVSLKLNLSKALRAILDLDNNPTLQLAEWIDWIAPESRIGFRVELERHLERKQPHFEHTYRLKPPRGSELWVHSFGIATFAADGKPVRLVGSTYILEPAEAWQAECIAQIQALSKQLNLSEEHQQQLLAVLKPKATV